MPPCKRVSWPKQSAAKLEKRFQIGQHTITVAKRALAGSMAEMPQEIGGARAEESLLIRNDNREICTCRQRRAATKAEAVCGFPLPISIEALHGKFCP